MSLSQNCAADAPRVFCCEAIFCRSLTLHALPVKQTGTLIANGGHDAYCCRSALVRSEATTEKPAAASILDRGLAPLAPAVLGLRDCCYLFIYKAYWLAGDVDREVDLFLVSPKRDRRSACTLLSGYRCLSSIICLQ
ncbi:hypothetical protein GWI33_018332 [Rhynchophorus ferrugineus]|uniref:Uncharacterized protein n=1 Tax=Rhynchophorus ferrugineus TaxID=354439 RepID=A0A834HV56_RHYFE|nr:hypothetical protein GWI33_018332 [Rhynchophorus ferrugineus]